MPSRATTVEQYLAALPEDRRRALEAVRATIKANLDPKFEEGIQYGMIGYYLPHSVYPAGYHCDPKQPLPFASIASQKSHIGIYLFCIYGDAEEAERFQKAWKATGKKLDMGKACVRFKKLEDVPLEVLGEAIRRATAARFVATYEAARDAPRPARKKAAKKSAKKTTSKAAGATAKKATQAPVRKAARKATRKAAKKASRRPAR